ncbi:MAG: YfhO family protein [Lachnospiraceae bacterium]|nr:YfhO family protein [Lachnospiraceae bacterium]
MRKTLLNACLAGVIVILMYIALLIVCDIAPFGDNTWIMYDLKRQYIDFYSYYKRICAHEAGILYSFETALGSGMIGFIVYYLNNPLFILFNLFDIDRLPQAISLVIGITLCLAAVLMSLYLTLYLSDRVRSQSENVNSDSRLFGVVDFPVIIGAVAWAFSGFMIAHSMNMMWTDVIILLPVIIYCTDRLIKDEICLVRSILPYIISLSLILLFNYYISYQILIYVGLYTLINLWVYRLKDPAKRVLRVMLCTFASVGIDAVVLLPTLFELADSPKDITQLGLEATGKLLTPVDVLSKIYAFAYDEIQPRFGLPQIYCGIAVLILLILYFLNKSNDNVNRRVKVGNLILLVIVFASFCIDELNLFWHALMEPSGHPYRQAPLFVFTMIVCAISYLATIESVRPETEQSEAYGKRAFIIRYAIELIILAAVLLAVKAKGYNYTSNKMILINGLMLVLFTALFILYEKSIRPLLSKMIMVILTGLLCLELLLNAAFTYPYIALNGEKISSYSNKVMATEKVTSAIKAMDSGFYRTENLTPRQQNDGMMYGYNGVTHYSSAGMTYVRYLLQKCGYNDDALYTHYGHDNTVTMDMLLGIKYVVTEDKSLVHKAYEEVDTGTDNGVSAYKNPYALSVAIATMGYDLSKVVDIEDPRTIDRDPFSLQEEMVSRLLGRDVKIFVPADINMNKSSDRIDIDISATADGEMYMYLDGLMGKIQGLAVYVDDELLTGYGNLGCYKILNLGYKKAGENLKISVIADSDEADFGRPIFVTEDMDELKQAYESISDNCIEITQLSPSSIELNVPECDGIFTSVPYEKGWNVPMIRTYGALMYIPVSGNRTLIMKFIPIGMIPGAVISIITITALIIYCIINRRSKESNA